MSPTTDKAPLGKPGGYRDQYSPDLLHPMVRSEGRSRLGIGESLPFSGTDIWGAYELSWLNPAGKPVAATAEFRFPATSPSMIESKSLKLYLNSLSGTAYESAEALRSVIRNDLNRACGTDASVVINPIDSPASRQRNELPGICIDDLDLEIADYDLDPTLLANSTNAEIQVTETLHSNLLKTNCPVTGQPDWASILIRYRGARISHDQLLRYLVSYRNHGEFHEQCVERAFVDVQQHCRPVDLTVYARFMRRGGLDINPFRSNFEQAPRNVRLWRQ